jgi:secondary thiamine-phosphate synthase enzyme
MNMGYLKEISIRSGERTEFIKLDAQVKNAIEESGVKDGVCYIYVLHTTAGVTINEGADPAVAQDIAAKLEQLVPRNAGYTHTEGNADSHIKAALVGSSAIVLIKGGAPILGTWQSIFFCEFDGPRRRQVLVRVAEA